MWQQHPWVPVLVVATEAERDALQARDLRRGDGDPFALVIVLWAELPILLQAAWTDPTLPCPTERVRWYGRTLYIAGFDPSEIQRTELLVDAQALGVDLQQCATLPEGASDATIVAWLLDALPPISLEEMIAQAQAAVTPEGEAAQVLSDLATVPEGERLATLLSEEVLCLLDVLQHTPTWPLWTQQAKALCPTLNLNDLKSILAKRRKEREAALKTAQATAQAATKAATNGHAAPPPPANPWVATLRLQTTPSEGLPIGTAYNFRRILEQHPYWKEPMHRLWFDSVRHVPMQGDATLQDVDVFEAAAWMGEELGMKLATTGLLKDAMTYRCTKHPRDLLREWLESLPSWDGEPRLHGWLKIAASVPGTLYHQEVSRLLVTSLVARALTPGCQYRYVVVLEGQQEIGKSKLLRYLVGDEWHTDLHQDFDNKEVYIKMRHAWLAELGELRSLTRTNTDRFKQFVTEDTNKFTPKYANFEEHHKRRTILVGTSNRIGQPYWSDDTGATRLLPVVCGKVVPEAVLQIRDQLFAEAIDAYTTTRKQDWWRIHPDALAELTAARELRTERSSIHDALATWLDAITIDADGTQRYCNVKVYDTLEAAEVGVPAGTRKTSVETILRMYTGLDVKDWAEKKLPREIPKVLQALGWSKAGIRRRHPVSGEREYPWYFFPTQEGR
jgi:hypothetical protein